VLSVPPLPSTSDASSSSPEALAPAATGTAAIFVQPASSAAASEEQSPAAPIDSTGPATAPLFGPAPLFDPAPVPPGLVPADAQNSLLVTVTRDVVDPTAQKKHVHQRTPQAAGSDQDGHLGLNGPDSSSALSASGSGGASGAPPAPGGGGAFSAGGVGTLAAPDTGALLAERPYGGTFPDDDGIRLPIERPD